MPRPHTLRGEVTSLTLPDGAVEQWAYDALGQTTGYTNPLGQTILYVYDAVGRLTKVDYPLGTDTTFTYDGADRLLSMLDSTGQSSWAYNAASEVTSLTTPQGVINYAYNIAGQRTSMTQVGTGVTTYSYDSAGRLSNTTDPFGDNTSFAYDSAGRLSKRSLANGTYEAFLYDAQSRVTEVRTMKVVLPEGPDTLIKSRAYTFDLASQVTSVVEGGITTNYAYDLAGQLTSEVKSSGYSASYTYDANGNRLSRSVNGVTENYSYDAGDKLLSVTGGVDPRNFVYDAAGRTTSIHRASGNTNFTYDYESRVTSITKPGMVTNSMSYNGLGTRVGLVDSGGSKQYVRDGVGVTAPVLSDGASTFTAGGERTGVVSKTLHSGLKNDDLQTNASGSVIGERLYDAFGNLVSNSGAWSSHSGYGGKFGYQDDADSSLKLLGHRYYDSSTGRFLTRDPIKDGRNWYVYCGSNPVSSADPSGLLLIVVLGVGAGLIAIASLGRWFYERKLEQEEDNRNKKDMEDRIIENELNIDSPVENTDHLINENRNRILDGLERQRQNALAQANSIYISGPATRSVVEVGAGFGAIFKIFQDYEEAKDVVSGTVEIGKAGYDEVKDRLKSQRHKLGGARDLWPRPVH